MGAGLALQHGGGQLELADGHDVGFLLHLYQALGQEQLQLQGQSRGTLRYCHPCGGMAAELPLTQLQPRLPCHTSMSSSINWLRVSVFSRSVRASEPEATPSGTGGQAGA